MIYIYTEKEFSYKGFNCLIKFMPGGYRCGYVDIPKSIKTLDVDNICCHGGITYNQKADTEKGKVWRIGFDCWHCFDGVDVDKIKEYYKDNDFVMKQINIMESTGWFEGLKEYPVRSLEYCEEQCKGIVDQIVGELNEKARD